VACGASATVNKAKTGGELVRVQWGGLGTLGISWSNTEYSQKNKMRKMDRVTVRILFGED